MIPVRIAILALTSLLVLPLLPAQRALLAGNIIARDDTPASHWKVIAVGRTVPRAPEIGTLDHLETITDESGRFRLRALKGVDYDLWAIGALDENGVRRTTPALALGVGARVTLREGEPQTLETVSLQDSSAWSNLQPFTLRVVPLIGVYTSIATERISEGRFRIPPVPGEAYAELIDHEGQVFWCTSLATSIGAERVLPVPVLQEIPVHVTEVDGTTPVQGVAIHYQTESAPMLEFNGRLMGSHRMRYWCLVGTTDKEGRVTVRLPVRKISKTPNDLLLRATADGYAEAHSGWRHGSAFTSGIQQGKVRELTNIAFRLSPQQPFSIQLEHSGRPIIGQDVLVTAISGIERGMKRTPILRRFVATSDEQGRLTVPAMPIDARGHSLVTDTLELFTGLRESRGGPFPTFAMQPFISVDGRQREDWNVTADATMSLQVLTSEGAPPQNGRVIWSLDIDGGHDLPPMSHIETPLDVVGRMRIRLPAGAHIAIVIADEGYATLEPVIQDTDRHEKVQLEPYAFMTILLRSNGKPVPNARFRIRDTQWNGSIDLDPSSVWLMFATDQGTERVVMRALSDDEGRARVPFIPHPNMSFRVDAQAGALRCEIFELKVTGEGEAALEVEMR